MGTTKDNVFASLRGLAYSGALVDMLSKFYRNNGAVGGTVNELEMSWLGLQGVSQPHVNDRWYAYLKSLGLSGTIDDMLFTSSKWDGGYLNPLRVQVTNILNTNSGTLFDYTLLSKVWQDDAGTIAGVLESPVGLINGDITSTIPSVAQATAGDRPVLSERINLLAKSNVFNDAAWTVENVTFAGGVLAPDGTNSAMTITNNGTVGEHRVYQNAPATSIHSHSLYAKAGTSNFISISTGIVAYYAVVDLSTGTVTASVGCTPTVTPAANGFWRIQMNGLVSTGFYVINVGESSANSVPAVTYAGTGKSVICWGAQLQIGSNVTTYQRVDTPTSYDTGLFPTFVRYDGVSDSLGSLSLGGGTSGFFLCKAIRYTGGAGTVRTIWSDAGTNTGYKVQLDAADKISFSAGNGTTYTTVVSAASIPLGTKALITVYDDGVNLGVQIDDGAITTTARPVVVAGTSSYTEGKDNGAATGFFTGGIYSGVYIKDTGLTAPNRETIKTYVKLKV